VSKANFKVGERYENRKGAYEVISIAGDRMVIKWDTGEPIETDVKGQHRVLQNMEQEFQLANVKPGSRHVPKYYGELFKGMQDSDFQDDVTGTHWRSREQLGGAVAQFIDAPFPVDSWSIYHRPEVHWADRSRYPTKSAWLQAKFVTVASKRGLWAGLYVERSDKPEDDRSDWNRFLDWLINGGEVVLAQIAGERGLIIKDVSADPDSSFFGWIAHTEGQWKLHRPNEEPILIPDLHSFLSGLRQDEWLDLVILKEFAKADAIAQGAAIAADIGRLYSALLPAYEAAIGRAAGYG
jgi:hypothetical protein